MTKFTPNCKRSTAINVGGWPIFTAFAATKVNSAVRPNALTPHPIPGSMIA